MLDWRQRDWQSMWASSGDVIVCFAKSLITFPVITKLMIKFDLWRLREAFGLSVLNADILAVEMQQR